MCVSCVFFPYWHSNYQETLYKTSNTWALILPLQNRLSFSLLSIQNTLISNISLKLQMWLKLHYRSTLASEKRQISSAFVSESAALRWSCTGNVTNKSLLSNSVRCLLSFIMLMVVFWKLWWKISKLLRINYNWPVINHFSLLLKLEQNILIPHWWEHVRSAVVGVKNEERLNHSFMHQVGRSACWGCYSRSVWIIHAHCVSSPLTDNNIHIDWLSNFKLKSMSFYLSFKKKLSLHEIRCLAASRGHSTEFSQC